MRCPNPIGKALALKTSESFFAPTFHLYLTANICIETSNDSFRIHPIKDGSLFVTDG